MPSNLFLENELICIRAPPFAFNHEPKRVVLEVQQPEAVVDVVEERGELERPREIPHSHAVGRQPRLPF